MPLYCYQCPKCEERYTDYRPMSDHDEPNPICIPCHVRVVRDFQAEAAGPHLDKNFDTPIEMHSIALNHPDDIAAFKRRNPDAKIVDGVPIAHNRSEKLRILKQEGYEEQN